PVDPASAAGGRVTPHALWWAGHAVLAGPVLAGAAAVSLLGAAVRRLDPAVVRRLPSTEASTWRGLGLRTARWLGGRPALLRLAGRDRLSARLMGSGSRLDVEAYVGWKAIAATAMFGAALIAPAPLPILAPIAGGVAFKVPDVALAKRAKRRRRVLDAQLPHLLDLLAAGSTAGLSALLALR